MTFDPTTWNPGAAPGISAGELNRIEQGIVDAHEGPVIAELNASAPPSSYPRGKSLMNVTSGSTGWPASNGSVLTYNGEPGRRDWQIFVPIGGLPSFRSGSATNDVWLPFQRLLTVEGYGTDIERTDRAVASGSIGLGTSFGNVIVATVNIPSHWGTWRCEAYASYTARASTSVCAYETLIRIDGGDGLIKAAGAGDLNSQTNDGFNAHDRAGLSGTGNRSVSLRARETAGSAVLSDIYLFARAVRTG